jgi:hypothetical protein
MRFKPFSEKYDFSKSELTEEYPPYLQKPIAYWIHNLVSDNKLGYPVNEFSATIGSLKPGFLSQLNTIFRETFPSDFEEFLHKIFCDPELTSNLLALLL